jgi:hypothetical protein
MRKRTALDIRMKPREAMVLYESICKRTKGTLANLLGETEGNNTSLFEEEDLLTSSIEMSEERGPKATNNQVLE